MSQKKTLLKYTKYVMWGTVALIPPPHFFICWNFTHTIRLRRYGHGRSF